MKKDNTLFFAYQLQSIADWVNTFMYSNCSSNKRLQAVGMLFLVAFSFSVSAQEVIEIYPGVIPGAKSADKMETRNAGMFRNVTKPALEMYLPVKEEATGTAVIICPGGSYSVLVYDGEGVSMAKALQQKGVAAFVLKYRLPDDSLMIDKSTGPLQDAQQAIKTVRDHAAKWGIDPGKIGIIGFSAGGHLASTVSTHFDRQLPGNTTNTGLRPDFQVLVYPVISMQDGLTHADSRKNLLGANSSTESKTVFSSELQVTKETPPAYITHASDDKLVVVQNSIRYYEALLQKGVPVEMHLYQKGGHGFIFRQKEWVEPLFQWMKNNNWIKK